MHIQWYSLRSKPIREELLYKLDSLRGIKIFYPRIRTRVVNPHAQRIKPDFPGYLSVHLEHAQIGDSTSQRIPGTMDLAAFGGEPDCVPDSLVNAIRTGMEDINAAGIENLRAPKSGDSGLLRNRPLAGYEAIFDPRVSGRERTRILPKRFQNRHVPLNFRSERIACRQHSV